LSESIFDQLDKTTFPQQVSDQVRGLIAESHLRAGDRLPSERAMADQFGVSRSSIREGIKLLAAQGLVEIRTGDGIYVTDDLENSVLQPLTWAIGMMDVAYDVFFEARMILEPALAALAAIRATEKDMEKMQVTINHLEESLGNAESVVKADMDFHLVIANSIRNQILCEFIVGLQRLLRPFLAKKPLDLEGQKLALNEHIKIFEAIKNGDANAARIAMRKSIAKDYDTQQLMLAIGEDPRITK